MRIARAKAKQSVLLSTLQRRLTDKTHRKEVVCEAIRIIIAISSRQHDTQRDTTMSISINPTGYDSFITNLTTENAKSKADAGAALQSKLSSSRLQDASDEELMDVCKSFESYLLEKVLEKTKKTLTDSEEEDSPYMNMFGDRLYQEYANQITEHSELGLAQQLFNAMKRDFGATRNDNTD